METHIRRNSYHMNEFNNSIIIYQPHADQPAIDVRLEGETVWLSQRQMGELFDVDVRTISEHLSNVFSSGELEKEATIRKFRIVRREGTRDVTRSVEHYNLDAIISVGYRVKSATATQFRIWATKRLREYLVQGYSINQQRLEQLGQIVEVMARADNHLVAGTGEVLAAYLPSLQALRDYDEGTLSDSESTGNAPVWHLTHADAQAIIARTRSEFPQDRLFGLENGDKNSNRLSQPSTRASRAKTSTQPPSRKQPTYCTSWSKTTRWLMGINAAPRPCSLSFWPRITCCFRPMAHRSSQTTP